MNTLLLEDNPLVAELIEQVLANLAPHAQVQHCSTLAAAKSAFLILCC